MKGELLLINNCDQQIHLLYIFIIYIYCSLVVSLDLKHN